MADCNEYIVPVQIVDNCNGERGNTKCIFSVGDESKNLDAGQIWIIDNVNRYHSVENKGETDRVHLIIDAI
jgi:hypothetical protein